MAEQQEAKGSIQVIERMMSLLDVLASTPGPATLKMLSQATGLHPSTAHRILAMMTHSRLVARRDASTYALGIRLLELGNIVKSRINIREVALPFMQQLHDTIDESINLAIRDGDEIVYIERTASGGSRVRVVYLVGDRAPLHLTSLGKLFLAAENVAEVRAYSKRTGLPGKTPHSLTSLAALEKELDKIRQHDLAYDNEEAEIGLRCLAAPIRDDQGTIIAGLSISAPTDRHDPDWIAQIKTTAEAISSALGYLPPPSRK
jgi:DNA-binding IclR family transcriptional regulator